MSLMYLWSKFEFRRLSRKIDESTSNFDPKKSKPAFPEFEVIINSEKVACKHTKRPLEEIEWALVDEIYLVTNSDGPFAPDAWVIFMGHSKGCSIPFGAQNFEALFDEFKERFPGFDYEAFIREAVTYENKALLWSKKNKEI